MNKLVGYLEPFHRLKPVTELGYWGRHRRDAQLRSVAVVFGRYALRWAVITAMLLALDQVLAPGPGALICAILSSVALSFVLIIATTAVAFVIGSKIRTA